jgi:cytochrome c
MHAPRPSVALACLLLLAGCGGGEQSASPGPESAAAPAAEPASPAAPAAGTTVAATDAELAARMAAADLTKGKVLFLQCRACHSLVPETEPGKIGPTLYGILGRAAGTAPGFVYSEAVAQSGIVWTPEQIDHWLERPSDFLPGNKMVFVGIRDPQDRANIIAFIQQESTKPAVPEAS